MRFKNNPNRLPHLNEVLHQQSISPSSIHEEPFSLSSINDISKQIKKSAKSTALVNAKLQKRLKLQKYRDKLHSDPKQNDQKGLDEDDERLIDFLRKYNEFMEKQTYQSGSSSEQEQSAPSSASCQKKTGRKPKLTKLERVMKDLECTLVQGNSIPNKSNPKEVAAAKRGILKTKKINMLKHYRLQKHHTSALEDDETEMYISDVAMYNYESGSNNENLGQTNSPVDSSLDELKKKLINSVIEKDALEESSVVKGNLCKARDEETPISALIKSNEMQILKSNSMDISDNEMENNENECTHDTNKEEEIVDEKVRRKIERQLQIDVTDKYNFLKQTARTKLRPKCTPDFEMNKRFRKNRYRIARNFKLKKTNLLSENNCGQNHFLGFDKYIKRFKDESVGEANSVPNCLVNRSYFNWDEFTVPTKVEKFQSTQSQDMTAVAFRDEMDFLMYSLVNKKAQSTQDLRLQRRLELWMKICKTRRDLRVKKFKEKYHLIENETCEEQLCDNLCELLNCDKKNLMLAVPNALPCPYLDVSEDCVGTWKTRLSRPQAPCDTEEAKSNMRHLIKQMIKQKQLRCNSTYAAYDISKQNATNLYQDVDASVGKVDMYCAGVDESLISCKTSRISYCTSGNYINVSVNLQSPMKRLSEIDSENQSLTSSCEQLPRAHIAKIEELFTDEISLCNDNETSYSSESTDKGTDDTESHEDTTRGSEGGGTSSDSTVEDINITGHITSNFDTDMLLDNNSEHNGLISSFLDYGNGQNTKRKKGKRKKKCKNTKTRRVRKFRGKYELHDKNNESGKKSPDRWGNSLESGHALPQQRTSSNNTSLDSSMESNSNSYSSMYDIVKTKTRHSLSKSIFNFENCKFPRKDGDVFYTTLLLNASECPVLALTKTKHPLPDYLSRYSLLQNSPKLSMKINKFTKLQIFVIYLKNMYFLFFKN